VREHLESFLARARGPDGDGHPGFIEREFRKYFDCGLPRAFHPKAQQGTHTHTTAALKILFIVQPSGAPSGTLLSLSACQRQ
jgi:hypothetical protein